MALNVGTLLAILRLDVEDFKKPLDDAVKGIKDASKEMTELGEKFALVGAAVAGVAAIAVKAASDFDETTNVVQTAFGQNAEAAEKWAATTGEKMGRSTQQMREFASGVQGMLGPMLSSQDAAAGMSEKLSGLAVDLASFYNTRDDDAMAAIKSGIVGMTEPLRRYGVVMTEANLKAYALSQGQKVNFQTMTEAAKVQLRYNYLLSNTTLAQGDAIKTAGSFANQLRRLEGNAQNLAVAFGTPLKNALSPLLQGFNKLAETFKDLDPLTLDTVARTAGLIVVVMGAAAAFFSIGGAIAGAVAIMPAIIAGIATFFTTVVPVVVIVGILALLIGKLYGVWKQFGDQIKDTSSGIFGSIKDAISSIMHGVSTVITHITSSVVDALAFVPRAMYATINSMLDAMQSVILKIKPYMEKLGLGDQAHDMLGMISGAKQSVGFDQSQFEDMAQGLKDAFNPEVIFGNAVDYWTGDGPGAQALKGAGITLMDSVKDGFDGLKLLLADVVDATGIGSYIQLAQNAANQNFAKQQSPSKYVEQYDFLGDQKAKFDEEVYNTFADMAKAGLKHAFEDPDWWKGGTYDFVYGLADNLEGVLPDSLKGAIESGAGQAFDFLNSEGGKNAIKGGAKALDQLLGGNLDLGSIGASIGDAIAPGVGGEVGKAVGEGIQKIADTIKELATQIVQGIVSMASTIGQIVLSGAQKTQGVSNAIGTAGNFAGTFLATSAAFIALTAIIGALVPILILLIPLFVALTIILSPLIVGLLVLTAQVWITAAGFMAIAAVIAGVLGVFVLLLQLGALSDNVYGAFKQFSMALDWGSRQIVNAAEPIYKALLPVAGVFVVFAEAMAPLITTFIQLADALGVFNALFEIVKGLGIALVTLGGMFLTLAGWIVTFLHAIGALSDKQFSKANDSITSAQTKLNDSLTTLTNLTLAQAAATATAGASLEQLAEAANGSGTMNLPEAFKLANARAMATAGGDVPGLQNGSPEGEKEMTLHLYLDGVEITNPLKNRFKAVVETGSPHKGRQRWRVPKQGN